MCDVSALRRARGTAGMLGWSKEVSLEASYAVVKTTTWRLRRLRRQPASRSMDGFTQIPQVLLYKNGRHSDFF